MDSVQAKRSEAAWRARRILIALLLVFALSFTQAFADADSESGSGSAEGIQTEADGGTEDSAAQETVTEDGTGNETGDGTVSEDSSAEEPDTEPVPAASIIKKGKYYYYQNADGVIRTKAGFVTADGKTYYVRRGGKIRTNETFRVKKKYYRADKYGVIMTGVYKWNGHYYYSYSKGQWRRKAGFITWNGHKYYVQNGGIIIRNNGFTVKNTAYIANTKGYVTKVVLPEEDTNAVVKIARKQVGIMTGKTYWVWYYRTIFRDTDRTPWCGAFVAWVYNKAGLYKKISVARSCGSLGYVPSYSRYADRYNKWVKKKNARPGDIIVFGRNRHVGLVEGVYGKYIVTIEGNAGPTAVIGCGKPGAVVRKIYKLSDKDIKGVIHVLK